MTTDGRQPAGGPHGQQPPPVPPAGYGPAHQPQDPRNPPHSPPRQYGYGYGAPHQSPQAVPPQGPPQPPGPPQGYGDPQQPPQGFGFPQAYGNTRQAYGDPQGPGAPQAYGNAQAYGYGGPGGPAGTVGAAGPAGPMVAAGPVGAVGAGGPGDARGRRKKPVGLILLLVIALLVLGGAGAGAWYMFVGSPSNNVLWSVPAPKQQGNPGDSSLMPETRGTWFTDEAVVHTLPDGVKAYDLDTGEQLWATALPGDANQACVAPDSSSGGIGVVAYGEGLACDHLVAYDLDSGKELWRKDLRPGDTTSGSNVTVARAGNVVVVTAGKTTLALNQSDGTPAWDPKRFATAQCRTGEFTGGKALIRVRGCVGDDVGSDGYGKHWDEVSLIDPATGQARWTYRHEPRDDSFGDLSNKDVISTSPIVIVGGGEDGEGLFALDDRTGKVRSRFSPAKPAEHVMTDYWQGGPWPEAAVFGDTFVLGASEGNQGGVVVAYDLDSGKQLWKTEPAEYREYFPLPAAGGDRILAYVSDGHPDRGPRLVELGAEDGAMKTVVEYPADADADISGTSTPYWHEERLYVSATRPPLVWGNEKGYSLIALPTSD